MVYSIERLKIGLIILSFVFIAFFFKLNVIFFAIISALLAVELYLGKFYKPTNLAISILILITAFLLKLNHTYSLIYFVYLVFFLIVVSLFFYKLLKFLFVPIIVLILIITFDNLSSNYIYFYLFLIISFINDTSAYLIGKNFKGPLIIPKISPNKTWTGTFGSFFVSFLIFYFIDFGFFLSLSLSSSLFIGDLYFSFVKRRENLKDFSNILISHGGILDRLDSFFFLIISFNLLNNFNI